MPALNETVSVSRRTHRALATMTVGDNVPLVCATGSYKPIFQKFVGWVSQIQCCNRGPVAKMGYALDSVDLAPESLQDYLQENPDSRVS